MGALSWLSSRGEPEYTVVFDIASGSIGTALVHQQNQRARILFAKRLPLQFVQEHTADEFAALIARTIATAAELVRREIATHDLKPADYTVQALLHTPWAFSHSVAIDTHLENETPITRELLRSFVADTLKPDVPSGHTIFNQHITRIELNGYSTTDPYRKKASHLAASVLVSTTPTALHTRVTTALEEAFPAHTPSLDAYLYAALQLPELRDAPDDITFIDIGGEYMSVAIIRDAAVIASAQSSFGTTHLIRAVADENPDAHASALSLVTMYLANTCTPSQCRQVEQALTSVDTQWSEAFGTTAATLNKSNRLPTHTYVSVDQRFAPWFTHALGKIDFAQFTVTARPLEPELIDMARATHAVQLADGVPRDAALILAAHFIVDK